jgi:hypothetical protein
MGEEGGNSRRGTSSLFNTLCPYLKKEREVFQSGQTPLFNNLFLRGFYSFVPHLKQACPTGMGMGENEGGVSPIFQQKNPGESITYFYISPFPC